MPLFNGRWVSDKYVEDAQRFWGPNAEQIIASQTGAIDAQSAERYRLFREAARDHKMDFFKKAAVAIGTAGLASGAFGGLGGASQGAGGAVLDGSGVAIPGTEVAGGAAATGMGGALGSTAARMAIPMGVSAMSGKGGGGGGNAGDIQAQIAQQMFAQTDPLRRGLLARSGQFLNGGIDSSAQFGAFKSGAEPQYAAARNNIIANTAPGGQLTAALTQLEGNRAQGLSQARGAVEESELARAMTLATGTTGQALGTLGSAANTQAMVAQSEADREAGMLGALGAGAGAYFGSKA